MKLNIKKTLICGVPFLTIMLLWQVYNWMVPLYLNDFLAEKISADKMVIGIIMSLDNLFALFMIPLVAKLSDNCKSKLGRRKPYIIVGIILSAIFFMAIPFIHESGNIWLLILNILIILISMNVYRAPAVALMPDITPEAQRNKANSLINILGGVGTALGFLLLILFKNNNEKIVFAFTSGLMILCLIYIIFCLKERKFVEEYQQANHEEIEEHIEKLDDNRADSKKDIIKMLIGILFFFMSINAVETFMSLYADEVFKGATSLPFGMDPGALAIVPFGIGCFAFSVPAAILADKFGRKIVVIIGALVVALAYGGITIVSFTCGSVDTMLLLFLVFFLIGGFAYACVIINILPMVLEYSNVNNTGKYTGHYYTASMVAQSITPALAGLLLSKFVLNSMKFLFPYAMLFILLSIVAFALVGKKKIIKE